MKDDASDNCLICAKRWSSTTRRHHCRKCKRLVCAACSPHKEYISDVDGSKKERCCENCFKEISYQRTLYVPKELAVDGVEWMDDGDSKCCVRCQVKFSINNRRHHCRNCGVLVCKKCSENKLQIEQTGDTADAEAQRCCDVCFETMRKLRQEKTEAMIQAQKEEHLLKSTSKVTRSLIKVFFLDGESIKTLKFCDNSTVADLSAEVCYGVRAAVFEVREDLRDPSQFTLLKPELMINDLLDRWERDNLTRVKLVIPFYDIKPMVLLKEYKTTDKSLKHRSHFSVANGPNAVAVLGREANNEPASGSELMGGASPEELVAKLLESQRSLQDLTQKYEKLEESYQSFKTIHKKKTRDMSKQQRLTLTAADMPVFSGISLRMRSVPTISLISVFCVRFFSFPGRSVAVCIS